MWYEFRDKMGWKQTYHISIEAEFDLSGSYLILVLLISVSQISSVCFLNPVFMVF